MQIDDRIRDFRRVPARELRPHPKNWRTHPAAQRDALRGVLAEIGYADALLARELDDGSLQLIDGHLRAETTPDAEVPVLVLDVTEAEAEKLLAVHDPLAAMAARDDERLAELLEGIETDNEALARLLSSLAAGEAPPLEEPSEPPDAADLQIAESWQVLVSCRDEDDQRRLYERLTTDGYDCRLLTL